MSDLQNQTPADTYKGLLQVNDYTNGVDATAKYIQDGEGTDSALAISTDKVGIGTDSPESELHIKGDITFSGETTQNQGTRAEIVHTSGVDANGDELSNDGGLLFKSYDNSTAVDALAITHTGKVGIGTTNPGSYKLNISGGNILTEGVVSSTSSGANIVLANSSTEEPYLKFDAKNSSTGINWTLGIVDDDLTDEENLLAFQRYNDLNQLQDTPLVIKSDGNVGIGTDSPDANLEIEKDSYGDLSAGQGQLVLDTKGVAREEGKGPFINFRVPTTGSTSEDMANIGAVCSDSTLSSRKADLVFWTRDNTFTEKMRIDSTGNVGIGTDSPSAPLEVASTTGGVIMPRMNTTERDAISSPTDGEMIYNTTTNKFQGRANGAWVDFH